MRFWSFNAYPPFPYQEASTHILTRLLNINAFLDEMGENRCFPRHLYKLKDLESLLKTTRFHLPLNYLPLVQHSLTTNEL